MKSLGSIFGKRPSGFSSAVLDDKTVFHVFSQVVEREYGIQGKKSILPVFYRDKALFVSFAQSLWAQEVWMNRAHLIKMLNEKLGQNAVHKIRAHQK